MINRYRGTNRDSVLLAAILASSILALPATTQTQTATAVTTPTQPVAPGRPGVAPKPPAAVWQGSQLEHLSRRAEMYYEAFWGVGELRVKAAESGEMIRFNYRVLDPQKAAALNDNKAEPELLDARAGVKLAVPQMEKIGKLRQSSTPKVGMTYLFTGLRDS